MVHLGAAGLTGQLRILTRTFLKDSFFPGGCHVYPHLDEVPVVLPQQNSMEQMLCHVTFRGIIQLQYCAEFSAYVELCSGGIASYVALSSGCRFLHGRNWSFSSCWSDSSKEDLECSYGVEQPEITRHPGSATTLFALAFPCTIMRAPIVWY